MALGQNTQQNYYDSYASTDYNAGTSFGAYQYVTLDEVISNFTATYVGEGKLLENVLRTDITFHAHRALQELSYDTLKSCKSQEIEVPPHLTMPLPHDYVNYVGLFWVDSSGIQHRIYPSRITSNPFPVAQNDDGDYTISAVATMNHGSSIITLDKAYTNIQTGMKFESAYRARYGPYSQLSFYHVESIDNSTGVSVITLKGEHVSEIFAPNQSADFTETVRFTRQKGGVGTNVAQAYGEGANISMQQDGDGVFVDNLTFYSGDLFMTAASAADIADVKPGMIISSTQIEYIGTPGAGDMAFPHGTRVVAVNGTTITTNRSAIQDSTTAGAIANHIVFHPADKVSDSWSRYKSTTPTENENENYEDDVYWPNGGARYGIDPEHAHVNGSYYIDCSLGKIHFSSNLSGKTVVLKYITDGITHPKFTSSFLSEYNFPQGVDIDVEDTVVIPKLAEEAIYKWIAYGCLIARVGIPEYVIARFKKEKFAETRKAKLRLSNIKLEEISQVFRGKSKQIKH